MSGPANAPLTIKQGRDWNPTFTWFDGSSPPKPVILTGYTPKFQIRDAPGGVLIQDCTAGGCTVTLGGSAGTITVFVPASVTSGFTFSTAFYDLMLTSAGGLVYGPVEGMLTLDRRVTI